MEYTSADPWRHQRQKCASIYEILKNLEHDMISDIDEIKMAAMNVFDWNCTWFDTDI